MLDGLFKGIFDSELTQVISLGDFLLCISVSLLLGLGLAAAFMYRTRYSRSFVVTLAILPAVVCVVIMMVNGNIGAGVAVAGAFSLVRFRSAPGTAKEIGAVFLAMGVGLIAGMGYLGYAVLFALILCCVELIYSRLGLGSGKSEKKYKTLRVEIPEDLDYTDLFADIFGEYTSECELTSVKTTNMGSQFRLTYDLVLKDPGEEKKMLDEIRCRNGNLEVSCARQAAELPLL